MNELPSHTLVLQDPAGEAFGTVRLAPSPDNPTKGDCIFDITLKAGDKEERAEVRWLAKRAFKKVGEHRFKVDKDGSIAISVADFRVVFDPTDEGHLRSRPPAPLVTAAWGEPA